MSSPPTVFVTGVTGYVGGDALALIYEKHPDWKYRFLVRSADRGAPATKQFPNGQLVIGDLSNLELLKSEAAAADIVIHFASSDDEPGMKALLAGAAAHDASRPAYLIHTSGTGSLQFEDQTAGPVRGELRDHVWDDVADVAAIHAMPDTAIHQPVDQLVFKGGMPAVPNVRRAVVCPPAIVGTGRGPVNRRSIQVPILADAILSRGRGFTVGRGLARWAVTHVADLSAVYLALAEDAARGGNGAEVWGPDAFFYVENGELEWGAVSKRLTHKLHQMRPEKVPDPDAVDELAPEQADGIFPLASDIWGTNSRCTATRARKVLGWKPRYNDFEAEYNNAVEYDLEVASQSRVQEFSQGHMPKFPMK